MKRSSPTDTSRPSTSPASGVRWPSAPRFSRVRKPTFWRTFSHGSSAGVCGTRANCFAARAIVGASPATRTVPRSASRSPPIRRISVDLPQPDGPRRLTNSPRRTERSTPRSASVRAPLRTKVLSTPRTSTRSSTEDADAGYSWLGTMGTSQRIADQCYVTVTNGLRSLRIAGGPVEPGYLVGCPRTRVKFSSRRVMLAG